MSLHHITTHLYTHIFTHKGGVSARRLAYIACEDVGGGDL